MSHGTRRLQHWKSLLGMIMAVSFLPIVTVAHLSQASGLEKPAPRALWDFCSTDSEQYCIELYEFTSAEGAKSTFQKSNLPISGAAQVYVSIPNSTSWAAIDETAPTSSEPPQLSVNFFDPNNGSEMLGATGEGVDKGTYRVVLRIGELDPTMLLLKGYYENYVVTKSTEGYYSVDVTARPIPTAIVTVADQDFTMLNACIKSKWGNDCVANRSVRSGLSMNIIMSQRMSERASRGSWISSNASKLQLPRIDLKSGQIQAEAAGPHFVPDDFNVPNLPTENGKTLNPAYFETFIPYEIVAQMFSQMTQQQVSVEQIQKYFAGDKTAIETTIEEGIEAVEKVNNSTITLLESGIRVNFNLTHFSAPNPKITFKVSTTKGKRVNSFPRNVRRGKAITVKKLTSMPRGYSIQKIVIAKSSKKVCRQQGVSVKMLKRGNCVVTVTAKDRKGKTMKFRGTGVVR